MINFAVFEYYLSHFDGSLLHLLLMFLLTAFLGLQSADYIV
jgi:hypothetical protein